MPCKSISRINSATYRGDVLMPRSANMAYILFEPKRWLLSSKTPFPTFNIIGSCADMFRFHADAGEIARITKGAFGMQTLSIMTSDTSVETMEQMGREHVNLVIRREGEPAAKSLKEHFGMVYIITQFAMLIATVTSFAGN